MKRIMFQLQFQHSDGSWMRAAGNRYSDRERAEREAQRRVNLNQYQYQVVEVQK